MRKHALTVVIVLACASTTAHGVAAQQSDMTDRARRTEMPALSNDSVAARSRWLDSLVRSTRLAQRTAPVSIDTAAQVSCPMLVHRPDSSKSYTGLIASGSSTKRMPVAVPRCRNPFAERR